MSIVRRIVPAGSFKGQRVLVVGGSRGLGELSAKIAAAGGAQVAISYAQGEDDAARVAENIKMNGGSASIFQFDVTDSNSALPPNWGGDTISHVYYFATPRIHAGKPGSFDQKLFEYYRGFYVTGLQRLLSKMLAKRTRLLMLFNPSTIFLNEPDARFTEYAAAKIESEQFCQRQILDFPHLSVLMPRLPHLKTDQTSAIKGEEPPGALETLLAVLPRNA